MNTDTQPQTITTEEAAEIFRVELGRFIEAVRARGGEGSDYIKQREHEYEKSTAAATDTRAAA